MIDLLEKPAFFTPEETHQIVAALREISGAAATVSGHDVSRSVEMRIRATTRLAMPPELQGRIAQLLLSRMPEIGAHFGVELTTCEPPQFLRYETGDFFVAHQDGNTPLIHDDTRFRKVSAVIFLSQPSVDPAPDTYGGGELIFHGPYSGPMLRVPMQPAPGTLVAFRSETTHEVAPVTHGERYTIVAWFR